MLGHRRQHDDVGVREEVERHPVRGAVHERRTGEELHAAVHGVRRDLLVRGPLLLVVAPSPAHRRDEDVALPPHHALGHAGRSARVEDIQVVGGPGLDELGRQLGRLGVEGVVEPHRAGEQIVARSVRHLEQHVEVLQPVTHCGQDRCECRVVHDGASRRVAQQVLELVGHVAVVDVEGGGASLVRTEHRLEVLGAVVQVERHVILTGLVGCERGAVDDRAESPCAQRVGELTASAADGCVAATIGAPVRGPGHDAVAVGYRPFDRFVDRCQVELGRLELDWVVVPHDAPRQLGPGGIVRSCSGPVETTVRDLNLADRSSDQPAA